MKDDNKKDQEVIDSNVKYLIYEEFSLSEPYMGWKSISNNIINRDNGLNLYHYTTIPSLMKIIKSQELFASGIRYLNDKMEFYYGLNVVKDVINSRNKDIKDKNFNDILDKMLEFEDMFSNNKMFIISFCEKKDLFNQWQIYSDKGNGCSIGFDAALIREQITQRLGDSNLPNQLNPNWAGPLKVVYDRNKQISLINEHIDRLKFVINKYKHKLSDNSTRLSIEMVATAYLSEYIFCFKDQAFEGEHEWRVIGWYNEQKMMRSGMSRKTFLTSLPIEYLPAHNCVKPFLRFKITTDMLKQVILSSTVQASSIPLDAVKDYLEINDFHSNIDFSMVQFR